MPDSAATLATYVIDLLRFGAASSTYKHAVLLGLMDLSLEKDVAFGSETAQLVTTRELALKVIDLYWNQTRPTRLRSQGVRLAGEGPRVLVQNPQGPADRRQRGGGIVADIGELRRAVRDLEGHRPQDALRVGLARDHQRLVEKVEWTLVTMPLPKLEGGLRERKIYEIGWDDDTSAPKRAAFKAYLEGNRSTFDNGIRLKPAAAACFRSLHGMLRPYIQLHWAMKVATFNKLEVETLHEELFGCERDSLAPVRTPLVELQGGRCFYCANPIGGTPEVDHFVPWSMQNNDCIYNLVATDRRCNHAKRDTFAAAEHVERWLARYRELAGPLEQIAAEKRWLTKPIPTKESAHVLYGALREDAPLWKGVARAEPNHRERIARAFESVRV